MKDGRRALFGIFLLAALPACATAPQAPAPPEPVRGRPGLTYLPPERITGYLFYAFEMQRFQGCWVDLTSEATGQLFELIPDERAAYRFRVTFVGQRTPPLPPEAAKFGHVGAYPCQIRMTRILSIEHARPRPAVLPGWENDVADVPRRSRSRCAPIMEQLIRPVAPALRDEAGAMLADRAVRPLSDAEGARLLSLSPAEGEPLAVTAVRALADDLRARKRRAEVDRRAGWSGSDQMQLDSFTAILDRGALRNHRPYLARAVSKETPWPGEEPFIWGHHCADGLRLHVILGYPAGAPSVRLPTVVFLPRAPRRVLATVLPAH